MLERLTPREADILKLLADGATNDGVARELAISPRTVQTHLDRLYRKLGVVNRTGAVAMYLNYDATGARAPTSIGVAGSKPHSAQDPS